MQTTTKKNSTSKELPNMNILVYHCQYNTSVIFYVNCCNYLQLITTFIAPFLSTSHTRAKEIFEKPKSDPKPLQWRFNTLGIKFKVLFMLLQDSITDDPYDLLVLPSAPVIHSSMLFWLMGCIHVLLSCCPHTSYS